MSSLGFVGISIMNLIWFKDFHAKDPERILSTVQEYFSLGEAMTFEPVTDVFSIHSYYAVFNVIELLYRNNLYLFSHSLFYLTFLLHCFTHFSLQIYLEAYFLYSAPKYILGLGLEIG